MRDGAAGGRRGSRESQNNGLCLCHVTTPQHSNNAPLRLKLVSWTVGGTVAQWSHSQKLEIERERDRQATLSWHFSQLGDRRRHQLPQAGTTSSTSNSSGTRTLGENKQ